MCAATFAGRLIDSDGLIEISRSALACPPREKPQPSDLLLQGLAVRATEGYTAGTPLLKEALTAFQSAADLSPNDARWLWLASLTALFMWDDDAWTVLFERQLELARQSGALSQLAFALGTGISVYAFFGEPGTAALLEQELTATTEATGIAPDPTAQLSLASLRGREAEFSALTRAAAGEAQNRGEGIALTTIEFLSGGLYNGLCRYEAAFAAVLPAEPFYTEGPAIWALTELIEAAVRCGRPERARRPFERVEETTRAASTDWALGIEARLRALLSDGDDAEELYKEAIRRLDGTRIRVQLARTHLLYGEWLRRERRRQDARVQLRTAYEFFRDSGMEAFAARARVELEATGDHPCERAANFPRHLTSQEANVALLAAQGETNREIAARLFISVGAVEYHLGKVFRKLGIKSRAQLHQSLQK
jgi:DNA-binding CsgD family transcriptional regulator